MLPENNAPPPSAGNTDRGQESNSHAQDTPKVGRWSTGEPVDFASIKAMAKARKCSVKNLLAMVPKNDPFYCGTPSEIAQGEWFGEVWRNTGFSTAHLRKVHYAHLSNPENKRHDGKPYENTDPNWDYLGGASLAARYLGIVSFDDIVDKKQPDPHILANYTDSNPSFYVDVPDLAEPYIDTSGFNSANIQPYHLEVWIEKSTMDETLLPICRKYNANLVTSVGEFTATAINSLGRRIRQAGKPARIFVIADFDPAGISIRKSFARRLEYFLRNVPEALDVRVCSLALNLAQVEQLNLPRVEIKETETRKDCFEKIFGEGGAELDALEVIHPGVLEKLLDGALSRFYSRDADRELDRRERELRLAVRAEVEAITEKYAEEIAALEAMCEELREIEISDPDRFVVVAAQPDPEDDEGISWLLDSRREYLEQLSYYRAFEGGAS